MRESYAKRQIILFIFLLIFLSLGIIGTYIGLNTYKYITLSYQENNNIDYKVYLKENDFFEEKYLMPGKTYITSLIDHIEATFNYNIDFNNTISSHHKYKIVAKIEANKNDGYKENNYWTKEYDITNESIRTLKKVSNYSISESINIDYNKFNNILNEFKKSVDLNNLSGVLSVYLQVTNDIEYLNIKEPIKSSVCLKLPLSESAIEATIENNTNNIERKEIKQKVREKGPTYTIITIIGIICSIIAIYLVFVLLRSRKLYKNNYRYDIELDKILNTYDSIIVNIKDLPDLEGYNLIKVEAFEELIDAHSEIRKPINYYKTKYNSVFLLISDDITWEYILSKRRIKK